MLWRGPLRGVSPKGMAAYGKRFSEPYFRFWPVRDSIADLRRGTVSAARSRTDRSEAAMASKGRAQSKRLAIDGWWMGPARRETRSGRVPTGSAVAIRKF
jgi:hypothetical protein